MTTSNIFEYIPVYGNTTTLRQARMYFLKYGNRLASSVLNDFLDEDGYLTEDGMEILGQAITDEFKLKWDRIYEALTLEYDVLDNYSVHTDSTHIMSGGHKNEHLYDNVTDQTQHGKTDTRTIDLRDVHTGGVNESDTYDDFKVTDSFDLENKTDHNTSQTRTDDLTATTDRDASDTKTGGHTESLDPFTSETTQVGVFGANNSINAANSDTTVLTREGTQDTTTTYQNETTTNEEDVTVKNTGTQTTTIGGSDTDTQTGTQEKSITGTQVKSTVYDNDTQAHTGTDTSATTGTDTSTKSGKENDTFTYNNETDTFSEYKHGNMGVLITNQSLVNDEIQLRLANNLYPIMFNDINSYLTIDILSKSCYI